MPPNSYMDCSAVVLQLNVHYKGDTEEVMVCIDSWNDYTIGDLQVFLGDWYELRQEERPRMWLVFKGRELKSDELVNTCGIENHSTVFMGLRSKPPSPAATSVAPAPTAETSAPPLVSKKSPAAPVYAPNDSVMNAMMSNLLAANPDVLIDMMQANPTTKAMLEKNPHMRHALRDPKIIEEMLQMATNPKAMQETLRGHDRALANIENVPGGFQALRQFFSDDSMMGALGGGVDELHLDQRGGYATRQERRTDPMPNPWSNRGKNQMSPSTITSIPSLSSRFPPAVINSINGNRNDVDVDDDDDFDTKPYEERFQSQLQTMREMGFTDLRRNIRALLATGGNVDAAIDRLLNK